MLAVQTLKKKKKKELVEKSHICKSGKKSRNVDAANMHASYYTSERFARKVRSNGRIQRHTNCSREGVAREKVPGLRMEMPSEKSRADVEEGSLGRL